MRKSKWEEIEDDIIASYGVKGFYTMGRKYKEQEHSFRTPFQRDRDRIIHSTAFRRLEYKTQVFVYHEGDYYRNRLTHTIEVQQIARTIARVLRLNEDLVEAISLAHDIGHTPFGHKGEQTLDDLLKKCDCGGFEHNRQGLRVVDVLENRYAEFPGLNLTFEVREGIIKHKTSWDTPAGDELKEFLEFKSPSLEAQVVNFADEIAYTSHDIDDGIKSGILLEKDLLEIRIWKELCEDCRVSGVDGQTRRRSLVRYLINFLVTDLVQQSEKIIMAVDPKSVDEVRQSESLIRYSKEVSAKHDELRAFLLDKMYNHYRVVRMAQKASRIICELFNAFVQEPRQLPPHIQERQKKDKVQRVVCDYIAGMTDRFAQKEYRRLFDPQELV